MCLVLATALPALWRTIVKMAGSSSEGRSSAQDFSEGKWNGGYKKSRVMI